jgi:hypothetical protein
MAALVPEDQATEVGEVAALVVPAVLVECQPVAEHDGDRRLLAGPRRRALDLDVQRHPVVGRDRHDGAAQLAERLVGPRVVGGAEGPPHRVALRGQPDRGTGDDHARSGTDHGGPATPHRHRAQPSTGGH